jgi:hypothetical protein
MLSPRFLNGNGLKITNNHDPGISATFYQTIKTISRPPQSRENGPLKTFANVFDTCICFTEV